MEVIVQRNEQTVVVTELHNDVTVVEQQQVVTVVPNDQVEIVQVGTQGPPGPPSLGETVLAATTLLGHRAVILNSAGKAEYASADNSAHIGRVIGISLNAANLNDEVNVRTHGIVTETGWNWLPDKPIFLGLSGNLTQTPLLIGILQIIGVAVTATSMMVRIHNPILR